MSHITILTIVTVLVWSLIGIVTSFIIIITYDRKTWERGYKNRGLLKNTMILFGLGPIMWAVLCLLGLVESGTKQKES